MIHTVEEACKSQHLWSASQRLRKADAVVQSKFEGQRTGRTKGASSSPRAGKDPSPSSELRSQNSLLLKRFFPLGSSVRLYSGWQFSVLSLLIQTLIPPTDAFTDTSRTLFDHMSGHPQTQSSWRIKLNLLNSSKHWFWTTHKF